MTLPTFTTTASAATTATGTTGVAAMEVATTIRDLPTLLAMNDTSKANVTHIFIGRERILIAALRSRHI